MAVDTSVIGKPTGHWRVAVERAPIANFAKAVIDDRPEYQSPEPEAPPTYSFVMQHWGQYPELQEGLAKIEGNPMFEVIGGLMANGGLVLHGEQEFEYHKPLKAGQVLRGDGVVTDAYEKETGSAVMTFVVSETVWTDETTGDPVVTTKFNLIHRRTK
ncbi:MAG: N-terminal half of MaoC dehydratase [Acidimicrobiales bacterium]|nr:N-terminal half of MaoC dehydratase [Acidimicrobiales bacterium]